MSLCTLQKVCVRVDPSAMEIASSIESQVTGLEAWLYNPNNDDQRLPHKYTPNRPISEEHLKKLGVLHWKIDADNWQSDKTLQDVRNSRGYVFSEIVTVAPGMIENYEDKIHQFFQEHLHPYDESRLILDGFGYWDIPDLNGDFIRFNVGKGDMITLPSGMYHRFTLDTGNYIKALLLFKDVPERIDVLKPHGDDLEARKDYVGRFLNNNVCAVEKSLVETLDESM
eukprot:c19356_g1_i1 orf=75-752(-)